MGRGPNIRLSDEQREEVITAILGGAAAAQSVHKTIEAEGLPVNKTWFFNQLRDDETLQYRWMVAKTAGAHAALDDCIDLQDEMLALARKTEGVEGDASEVQMVCPLTTPQLNAFRAVIDYRKWQIARLLPKHYGDKLNVGADGLSGAVSIRVDFGEQKGNPALDVAEAA